MVIQWVGARDAANYCAVPRMAPWAKSDPVASTNSAEVEKPWAGEAGNLQRLRVCPVLMHTRAWRPVTQLCDSKKCGPRKTPCEIASYDCLESGISANIWSTRPSGPNVYWLGCS